MKKEKYFDKVSTGKLEHTIRIHPECPACQAKNHEGESIRLEVDKMRITKSTPEIKKYLKEFGVEISDYMLKKHFERHSPYVNNTAKELKKMVEDNALDRIDNVAEEYKDAEEVIQNIIDIGGAKVASGEIKVGEKILMQAIKEQGTRKKTGTLRELFEAFDKARFPVEEGEVIEDGSKAST